MDGLAAKDLAAALLHTREAIRLAQSQKQARIGARWRAGVRPRDGGGGEGGEQPILRLYTDLFQARCWYGA